MLTGRALIADVEQCTPAPGQVALWWLGQHGFILKMGATVVCIDAFFTRMPERLVQPLLRPEDATNVHVVLGTHDHGDHIDRPAWPALAAAAPQARFVVPELLRSRLAAELAIPAGRFVGIDDGVSVEIGGVVITGVAAAHEFLDQDAATGRYPYLGYVLEGNGVTLYHAGDCCVYEGLLTKLRRWPLDVALLPINGRDAARLAAGCIGNMTYQEAADLAGALRPRCTVPTHYDMFAMNAADPRLFTEYMRVKYPQLRTRVCDHGVRAMLPAG
jgi:L-ascorbate 6-phosphate lactonase